MSEQEQKELALIGHVFEKFLYAKLLAKAGYTAEGLRLVWLDEDSRESPTNEE